MPRLLPALFLSLLLVARASFADEASQPAPADSSRDASTLRLYFAPAVTNAQRGTSEFVPEVARLFVDDQFVGNAIVNLHGHLPTLRFRAGAHTIRVKMGDDREFDSKITFLGQGSVQYLFVDFDAERAVASQ